MVARIIHERRGLILDAWRAAMGISGGGSKGCRILACPVAISGCRGADVVDVSVAEIQEALP